MGEIEKLRQAREAMSAIFPLTPQMWQEWAKDEASISTAYFYIFFSSVDCLLEQGITCSLLFKDVQIIREGCFFLTFLYQIP
uniref:Squamous cell carcinoma antigen recognized by T-cells 3-like n=1 Tax=Rhizophora mucronata TaxID=61149 RepID=A0A2P2M5T6_RHIMU